MSARGIKRSVADRSDGAINADSIGEESAKRRRLESSGGVTPNGNVFSALSNAVTSVRGWFNRKFGKPSVEDKAAE